MKSMIGVYGANGFIGRHLVARLARKGFPLRAISRKIDPSFSASLFGTAEFLDADLRLPIQMASSLQGIETVVQLISTSSPGLKNDHALTDIAENVVPHVDFLANCVRAGVKRYIFLSSGGAVYGPRAEVPTRENSPTDPICSHGLTKLTIEKYIQMHGHIDGLEYVILRLTNPFGPGQQFRKGQGLIPAVLDRYRQGLPIHIFGRGQAKRDYLYIDDAINAIEAAITLSGSPKSVLNIGSGETRAVVDVIEAIEEIIGVRFERKYVPERPTDVDVVSLDVSQAGSALGWSPQTEFHEGLKKTLSDVRL